MIKLLKDMPKEFFEKFSKEEIEFMKAWEEYYIHVLMQRDRAKEPMTDMYSLYCGECRYKVGVYGLAPRYNFCPRCGGRIRIEENRRR